MNIFANNCLRMAIALKDGLEKPLTAIMTTFNNFTDKVLNNGLTAGFQYLAQESTKWTTALENGITSAINGISNFVSGGGLDSILTIGTNIITGICDGIIKNKEQIQTKQTTPTRTAIFSAEEALEEEVVEEETTTTEVEPEVDPAELESPQEDEVEEINIEDEFIGGAETSDEDMDAAFNVIGAELEQEHRKNVKGYTVRLCENASPLQKAKITKRADTVGVPYFIDPKTNNITTNTFVSLNEAQEYKRFISRKGLKGQVISL